MRAFWARGLWVASWQEGQECSIKGDFRMRKSGYGRESGGSDEQYFQSGWGAF
jgi:hypothetical protein